MSGRLNFKRKQKFLHETIFFFPCTSSWIFVKIKRRWIMKFSKQDKAGHVPTQHVRK